MMARWFTRMSSFAVAALALIAMPSKSQAWSHGCHLHRYGGTPLWGSYGMGGGFRQSCWGGYSGILFSTGCAPARSCYASSFSYYSPRCLSYGPSFSTGFYGCAPFFPSYYCPPVFSSYYCSPIVYRPVITTPVFYVRPAVAPIIFQAPRIPICVSKPTAASHSITSRPVVLPKANWLASAVELIDLMVHQGGVAEGLQACEQLIRVREGLPSEIYWRAAALAAVSGRESLEILALIDNAEKAGDRFSPSQLPGGSLRAYLRTANVGTLDESLNRLAEAAMTNPNPTSDYRVLSAILALDNQPERSRLFLAAANKSVPAQQQGTAPIAALASLDR